MDVEAEARRGRKDELVRIAGTKAGRMKGRGRGEGGGRKCI